VGRGDRRVLKGHLGVRSDRSRAPVDAMVEGRLATHYGDGGIQQGPRGTSLGHQDLAAPQPLPCSWLTQDFESVPVRRTVFHIASRWRMDCSPRASERCGPDVARGQSLLGALAPRLTGRQVGARSEGANAGVAVVGKPRGWPIGYCARTMFRGGRLFPRADPRVICIPRRGGCRPPCPPHIHDYCRIFLRRLQAVCKDFSPKGAKSGPIAGQPAAGRRSSREVGHSTGRLWNPARCASGIPPIHCNR
jgi:hypothetical protein